MKTVGMAICLVVVLIGPLLAQDSGARAVKAPATQAPRRGGWGKPHRSGKSFDFAEIAGTKNSRREPSKSRANKNYDKMRKQVRNLQQKIRETEAALHQVSTYNERLMWLCAIKKIDAKVILDESLWAQDKFTSPMAIGQRAFVRGADKKSSLIIITQVVDDQNFVGALHLPDKETVWVKGVSTAGMTDGKRFTFDQPFLVTGTTTYTNVAGSTNTVFVLTPTVMADIPDPRSLL